MGFFVNSPPLAGASDLLCCVTPSPEPEERYCGPNRFGGRTQGGGSILAAQSDVQRVSNELASLSPHRPGLTRQMRCEVQGSPSLPGPSWLPGFPRAEPLGPEKRALNLFTRAAVLNLDLWGDWGPPD